MLVFRRGFRRFRCGCGTLGIAIMRADVYLSRQLLLIDFLIQPIKILLISVEAKSIDALACNPLSICLRDQLLTQVKAVVSPDTIQ